MVHSVNVAKDDVTMVRDGARYRQKTGGRTRRQLLVRLADELLSFDCQYPLLARYMECLQGRGNCTK